MRKLAGIVAVAIATVVAWSCGNGPTAPIDRQVFEDAMVQLRRAEAGVDSAEFGVRRQKILDSLEVTDSMLYAFVAAHATDPKYMSDVWTAIDLRVNVPPEGVGSDTVSRR